MHPKALAVLLLLAIALPAAAVELTGPEVIIPVVGRAPGLHGTFWKTDVYVTNLRSHGNLRVLFEFMSGGTVEPYEFWLGPREVYVVQDYVLIKHRRESAVGLLRISTKGDAPLSARAWVYHRDAEGREVGQNVQGIATRSLMRDAYLTGLVLTDLARTNVGIANPHDVDAEVTLVAQDYWRDEPRVLRIPARSVVQVNLATLRFFYGPREGVTLQVRSRVPVYPYASVVRNSSGDPQFVPPAELHPQLDVAANCVDAAVLWDRPGHVGERWHIWLRDAADGPALAAKYGFEIDDSREKAIAADLSLEQLSAVRCDPAVTFLGWHWPSDGDPVPVP